MTIRDLFREFVIGKQRKDDEHDRDIALAWHVEAFARHKKLPDLATLMTKPMGPQTVQDPKSIMKSLSEHLGVPLRKTRLIKREAA